MDDNEERKAHKYRQQISELRELLKMAEMIPDDPESQIAAQHFRDLLNAYKARCKNISGE